MEVDVELIEFLLQLLLLEYQLAVGSNNDVHLPLVIKTEHDHLSNLLRFVLQSHHPAFQPIQLPLRFLAAQSHTDIVQINFNRIEVRIQNLNLFMHDVDVILFNDVLDLVDPLFEGADRD